MKCSLRQRGANREANAPIKSKLQHPSPPPPGKPRTFDYFLCPVPCFKTLRCGNRKSCRRPAVSLSHATKIATCKSALRRPISIAVCRTEIFILLKLPHFCEKKKGNLPTLLRGPLTPQSKIVVSYCSGAGC